MSAIVYATLIVGVFSVVAFIVINIILIKNRLNIGLWGFFPFIMISLLASQYFLLIRNNIFVSNLLALIALILLFFVSLIKFWDVMGLTERGY